MSTKNAPTSSSLIAVSGIVPLSTSDYPGQLAAVLFCQGCPWRCRYCHNPHLQSFSEGERTWEEALQLLRKRRGLLDAVVFSGGEPTMQPGLEAAIDECRSLGFKVGLHTAGINPTAFAHVLPKVDWVGLDFKALPEKYASITGNAASGQTIIDSVRQLLQSQVPYEIRTTYHSDLITQEDLRSIGYRLSAAGVTTFVLQIFRSKGCNDTALSGLPTDQPSDDLVKELASLFEHFQIRGA